LKIKNYKFSNEIISELKNNNLTKTSYQLQREKENTSSGSVSPSNSTMTGAFILFSQKNGNMLEITNKQNLKLTKS